MFVHLIEEPKVGIKTIKMYCQKMQEQNITRAIIVVQMGMTPSAKQVNLLLKRTLIQTYMIQSFVMFFFFFLMVFVLWENIEANVFLQSLVDMAPKYILEQFLQQELLINITEHEVYTAEVFIHFALVSIVKCVFCLLP